MTALADPMATPEWAQARADWRAQADATFDRLHLLLSSPPASGVSREDIYAPVHDIAGLAGVFENHVLGKMSRALMEMLRRGPELLDASSLRVAQTYLVAMAALHARDIRGEGGSDGDAILAELAAIPTRD
jgi:hypothetical protein